MDDLCEATPRGTPGYQPLILGRRVVSGRLPLRVGRAEGGEAGGRGNCLASFGRAAWGLGVGCLRPALGGPCPELVR